MTASNEFPRPRGRAIFDNARTRPRGRAIFLSAFACAALLGVTLLPAAAVARAHKHHHHAHRSSRLLKMIWGPVVLPNGKSAFPTYHRLGVNVFQVDLDWADTSATRPVDPTNPNDPAYRWSPQLDQAVQQAAFYGIRICLLVKGTPGWANGGRSQAWAPNDANDYANFLIAASHHYSSVRYWMVWGEPNRDQGTDFQPMPLNSPVGPRRYAVILNAGYHALKSVSPSNIVIGGNTWSFGLVQPADFVRWMRLPNGKPPPLDYYGHNPFGRRFPKLTEKPYFPGGRDINDVDTLETELHHTYHRRVRLWLSEFTIDTGHDNYAFNFHTTPKGQAKWLTAAFKLANSVNYVVGMGWFSLLDDPPKKHKLQQLTTGLMTWNMHRKPSFRAYERAP